MLQAARYLLGSPGASGFGSKSTAEEVTAACPDLDSLTAIITGATSGIGAETARVLAKRGARVVIPARNVKAAEEMRARIQGECPGADVLVLHLDLSSLASVRAFARRFLALGLPLHLLINNAGKFSHGQLALSEDGVEMTFATNYLGHFLLTELLLGRMAETAADTGVQGRIVNVSSSVHGWFAGDWADYLHLVTRRKMAANLARELKTIKSELHFMQERCGLLEEKNKRLRDGYHNGGAAHEEDDLVRLQLEALLAEKSRLAQDNANLARENQSLIQLVEYHQLTSQEDLAASYEDVMEGMRLDFSTPMSKIHDEEDEGEFDTDGVPVTPGNKLGVLGSPDE